ncbi:MAG TPA: FAD-dependent oxidoreductase [Streptosporangiaceae bacterium]|jgi:NADPH-dependent 2,4-dienoyl-CoA reductase/sulfur reductase-like enzyme
MDRVVVVGGGLAGLRAIEELRARGYQGGITLVGAENRSPYDRPPLSKKVMTGELDDTSLRADFAKLQVDFRAGETATALEDGVLRTGQGGHPFDGLVIATGATPVTLPGAGRQRVLRSIDEALELRAQLRPGVKLVVAGAGWIGAELATAAASLGAQVTVLDAATTPLAVAVGAEVGARTAPWYAAAGVELLLNQAVESVQPGGLALAGGGWLAADLVVTAVGVRPAIGWLAGSGVELDRGVATDEGLRTSVPGVYAVGDCASFVSRRYGRRLRFEHWDVALHAPEVAAANLLGGDEIYDPVPYFWSEQFGRMLQYIGYHGAADHLVWRGDPAGQNWAACWLDGQRLVALLTVDRPRDLVQGRRVIAAGAAVDIGRLTDPAVPIRDLAVG